VSGAARLDFGSTTGSRRGPVTLTGGVRRGPYTTRLYFTLRCTIKEPPPFCQAYGALVLTLSAHVR
jgi:hypothetical protein